MTIAVASSSSNFATGGGTSIAITAPSGIVSGDLLVALISSASGSPTPSAPSGWAQIGSGGGAVGAASATFVKTATGSEPGSYTFTGPNWVMGIIFRLTGADSAESAGALYSSATGSPTACTAPSQTPTVTNDMLITHWLSVNGFSFSTPTGMTVGPGYTGGAGLKISTFTQILATTSATGTISSTQSTGSNYVSASLLVKPAAGPLTGTATVALGALSLTSSGTVSNPPASSSIALGPLTLTASGTGFTPFSTGVLALGPLSLASTSTIFDQWGNVSCARMAWLTLGSLSVPLQNERGGWFCTSLDLGYPTVREVINNLSDRDGAADRTQFFGPRAVTAAITALTGASAQIDAVASTFAPFMSPAARPVLHYVLDRPGAAERTLTLRAAGYSWPIVGPYQRDIQLQWVAADPIARDPTVKNVTATVASVATIVSVGEVAVRPLFRLFGPITGAVIALAPIDGGTWYLAFPATYVLASGHHIDIDTSACSALLDGDPAKPVLAQLDWTRTSWQWIPPGPSSTNVSLNGTATTTATKVQAFWQDGYLT